MALDLSIFKDYDIRGTYPNQINGDVARSIANAIVAKFKLKTIAIVRDMRLSGKEIRDNMVEVFLDLGVDVFDAGLGGTEMAYYIAGTRDYELTLMISASHNPPDYNGIKVVKKGPVAVTSTSGLYDVRDLMVSSGRLTPATKKGVLTFIDIVEEWKAKVHSLIDPSVFKPLSVVADAGNGMAGMLVPKIFEGLPFKLTPLYFELDGHFPNHIPNPLVETNNRDLIAKIREIHADVGITFDGDADRMFLVDDTGRPVSGTVTTALLARYFLKKNPGELILYNAICGRIVKQTIEKYGGKSKRVRVGHSYIKTYMNETKAIFAGEHSGHYYFRDFFKAESGVLSALLVFALLSTEGKKLSQMVAELDVYPASGEINFIVENSKEVLDAIRNGFTDATNKDELDGITVWYDTYWFNVRLSKTEPLLRLNVEADNAEILKSKTDELVKKIQILGGKRK